MSVFAAGSRGYPVETYMKKNNYQSLKACRIAASILVAIALSPISGSAATYTANYLGGTGVWEQDGSNWDTLAYPHNGHFVLVAGNPFPDGSPLYNVVINQALPCALGTQVDVESVSIANGSTLNLLNNSQLKMAGPFTNNGQVTLNSTGGQTLLLMRSNTTIAGNGSITMGNNFSNAIVGGNANGFTLTLAPGRDHPGRRPDSAPSTAISRRSC